MELKGNKGEWSELYAFLKLLGEGKLYCGDGALNRYDDKCYPILKIFRNDDEDRNSYIIKTSSKEISIQGEHINTTLSQQRFKEEAQTLLAHIKGMEATANFPYLYEFLQEIDIQHIKAKSKDKADIRIVIHNLNTGSKPELGYSIKSKLGAPSTLINANKNGTNFIYEIQNISEADVATFNNLDNFKKKFEFLDTTSAKIVFHKVANHTLHNNLMLLDLGMERIIAETLLAYYTKKGKEVDEITQIISQTDPLEIAKNTDQPMYEYKMKQWLLAFALGMTCTTPWYGNFNANGGYIIVKEDGDIVCYHFFDRNDLENYLFHNTKFETPSTSRHLFGNIYQEGKLYFMKLNLQVRFK